MSNLLNETAAAEVLAMSVKTLRKWRLFGGGPVFRKIGTCVRYRVDDLEEFIEAGRRVSTSDPGVEGDVAHA